MKNDKELFNGDDNIQIKSARKNQANFVSVI